MNDRRFRISHLFLFLLLLAGCVVLGYIILSAVNAALAIHWAYLLSIVIVLPAFAYFCFATYNSLKQIIQDIKAGGSTSYYADKEN